MMSVEISADFDPVSRKVSVRMFARGLGQFGALAEPVVFKTVEQDGLWAPPALVLDMTAAQQMVDELWRCGLRPSEGSGSAGALAATERHLADMRTIALASLEAKGIKCR